jgi:hypothetical protein
MFNLWNELLLHVYFLVICPLLIGIKYQETENEKSGI